MAASFSGPLRGTGVYPSAPFSRRLSRSSRLTSRTFGTGARNLARLTFLPGINIHICHTGQTGGHISFERNSISSSYHIFSTTTSQPILVLFYSLSLSLFVSPHLGPPPFIVHTDISGTSRTRDLELTPPTSSLLRNLHPHDLQ